MILFCFLISIQFELKFASHPSSHNCPIEMSVPDLLAGYKFIFVALSEKAWYWSWQVCDACIDVLFGIYTFRPLCTRTLCVPRVAKFPQCWLALVSAMPNESLKTSGVRIVL
jgi:hypothetical protein